MKCANCGEPVIHHRCVHLVPCCPGKCRGAYVPSTVEVLE